MVAFPQLRTARTAENEHADVVGPRTSKLRVSGLMGRAPIWFGASVLAMFLAGSLSNSGVPAVVLTATWIGAVGFFALATLLAYVHALRGIGRLAKALRGRPVERPALEVASLLGNLVMAGFGTLLAYLSTFGFARGRQLRRFGRVLLPSLRPSRDWTTVPIELDSSQTPPGLADQWRENGRTEHASVAAFARLTFDLMALGAPPSLIAAANRDALDEIRHTELCFSLAQGIDGRAISPAPFPRAQSVGRLPASRTLALAQLAVGSLIDGALHEGVSARIIAKLARRCESPAIRAVLRELAADEGRHAAHGWTVVVWCLDEGGPAVESAVLGALNAIPRAMRSNLPAPAAEGAWERWGIPSHQLEADEYASARAQVIDRIRDRVSTGRRTAA